MFFRANALTAMLYIFSVVNSHANAERPDSSEQAINPQRLAIVGSAIGAGYATAYLILKHEWWNENTSFHFEDMEEDFMYAINLDKFGHFFMGVALGEFLSMNYEWVGMSPFASGLWAGITVSATQFLIEVKDAYSPFGYSAFDALAGSLGGFYSLAKRHVPAMQYVDYKFTYFPNSKAYLRSTGGMVTSGGTGSVINDYYGGNQSHWLSFKVAKMLPSEAMDYYPEWLALAFGWGIDDRHFTKEWGASRYEFYISPDYDLEAIFHPQKTWSRNVIRLLNLIKFPAPALRIGRDPKFFLLHPWYGVAVQLSFNFLP